MVVNGLLATLSSSDVDGFTGSTCSMTRTGLEREVLRNFQAIVQDADKTPITEVARTSIGVLTAENRERTRSVFAMAP
ncbi:hypothetical protein OG21DRAFT_1490227 [Imleria badia]|nr:hypothetical protein OG21DRAFT_1490227 [Imleria badia]